MSELGWANHEELMAEKDATIARLEGELAEARQQPRHGDYWEDAAKEAEHDFGVASRRAEQAEADLQAARAELAALKELLNEAREKTGYAVYNERDTLRAEVERLRTALEAVQDRDRAGDHPMHLGQHLRAQIRAALEGKE